MQSSKVDDKAEALDCLDEAVAALKLDMISHATYHLLRATRHLRRVEVSPGDASYGHQAVIGDPCVSPVVIPRLNPARPLKTALVAITARTKG